VSAPHEQPLISNRTVWCAIGLTWLVTTILVGWGGWRLREQLRAQLVGRDSEILMALARTYQRDADPDDPMLNHPMALMVSIGNLDGIIAGILYDGEGDFVGSMPTYVHLSRVPQRALARLRQISPAAQYEPSMPAAHLTDPVLAPELVWGPATIPVVRVFIPLNAPQSTNLDAIAEFIFEGSPVAREFARLDRRLAGEMALALVLAFATTGFAVAWAFRRLARAHKLLAYRTHDLQRANHELSQSARVAVLGAITAHLMHSLKTPVSGLRSFMEARRDSEPPCEEAWGEALAATRRMQEVIQQVVRVLGDHEYGLAYEVTFREIGEGVVQRARACADACGVYLEIDGHPNASIDNRRAGLLSLLLTNLIDNAIQASDDGGTVKLRLAGAESLICEVMDAGHGIPPRARARLFQPQQSTKEGGSGLGLAIARQLALALGGSLELVRTGPAGTVFRVSFPADHRATRGEPILPFASAARDG
jgi:signal transduction histidine kinase